MKQKYMYTYRCMSKLCSLFCLETNNMNIKRNVTCEEPCSSTLQRFPTKLALKRFFLLVETWVLCTLIDCFHCYPLALLKKLFYSMSKKLQEHFRMTKGYFAVMENYIMVKQSGRWLNELNHSRNTFCTTQSFSGC